MQLRKKVGTPWQEKKKLKKRAEDGAANMELM